jgi:type II secretion system protein N
VTGAPRIALPVAGVLLFGLFLVWLFPLESAVRHALARATPAGGATVVFRHATLRPDGIHLEDVSVQATTGAVVRVGDVRVRPSAWGLLRDGTGLPWHLEAALCDGRLLARVLAERGATAIGLTIALTITLTWEDADLAACPPLPIAAGAMAGRARAAARLRLTPAAWLEGDGRVEVDAGQWQGTGLLTALGTLHAESASVRWTLRDGRLALDALDLRGPEMSARGSGVVDLVDPLPDSGVQVTLALATAPDAPPPVRLLLGPPGNDRRLEIGGTLARPSALVLQ